MFAKQIDEREADIETAELLSGEKQNHIFGESKEEQALRWRNFKGMEARELHKHFVERVFVFLINLNSDENSAFSRYLKHATFKINEPLALQKVIVGLVVLAGFLISSAEYIRSNYGSKMADEQWKKYATETFTGFDTDETMCRLSCMNLMLHSATNPQLWCS